MTSSPKKEEYFSLCLYSFTNYPDGLIRASVRDLSRFLMAYINGGAQGDQRNLKQKTILTMLSAEHFGRGLCWENYKLKNRDLAWCHGGSDPGIKTRMTFRAKHGVGVILFFNCGSPGQAPEEIRDRLHEEAANF
jgi:CubicO group peptidase (beta-lactamase class C family)